MLRKLNRYIASKENVIVDYELVTMKTLIWGNGGLNQRIIMKYIRVWRCGLELSGSRRGPVAGCCERCYETLDSIKSENVLFLIVVLTVTKYLDCIIHNSMEKIKIISCLTGQLLAS
jgi:hypothetical protein